MESSGTQQRLTDPGAPTRHTAPWAKPESPEEHARREDTCRRPRAAKGFPRHLDTGAGEVGDTGTPPGVSPGRNFLLVRSIPEWDGPPWGGAVLRGAWLLGQGFPQRVAGGEAQDPRPWRGYVPRDHLRALRLRRRGPPSTGGSEGRGEARWPWGRGWGDAEVPGSPPILVPPSDGKFSFQWGGQGLMPGGGGWLWNCLAQ